MKKNNYFAIKCIATFIFFIPFAYSQTRPNDVDLKSAYCIEALKSDVVPSIKSLLDLTINFSGTELTKGMSLELKNSEKDLQIQLEKTYQDIDRLQSYLIPRISGMDVRGLELAQNRAKEDSKLVKSCNFKCSGNPNPNPDLIICFNSCLSSIGKPDQRIDACSSINFLPF